MVSHEWRSKVQALSLKHLWNFLSESKQHLETRSCNSERAAITYRSIKKQGYVFKNLKPSNILFILLQLTRNCFWIWVIPGNCWRSIKNIFSLYLVQNLGRRKFKSNQHKKFQEEKHLETEDILNVKEGFQFRLGFQSASH